MKKIVPIILMSALFFALSSCKKKGCTEVTAENFDPTAKKDDGTCVFPYEKFLGTYAVQENYTSDFCGSGPDNYAMVITQGASTSQVVIDNLSGLINGVVANVSGNVMTIPTQFGKVDQGGDQWDVCDLGNCTGSISGNTLTFAYVIDDILYNNTCGQLNGSCVATK